MRRWNKLNLLEKIAIIIGTTLMLPLAVVAYIIMIPIAIVAITFEYWID